MPKKIVVTGASGFIGRQLVPRLVAAGCQVLVVGRAPAALAAMFPGLAHCGYDQIGTNAQGFDCLVHLAVLNNDQSADAAEFQRVNVDLLAKTVLAAKSAGIATFVNVTTFHATGTLMTDYAKSKRAALALLESQKDIHIQNMFLPAVYGDDFAGKLGFLKRVPALLRRPALSFLTALAPTVHVDKVAAFLTYDQTSPSEGVMLYNTQDNNAVYRIGKRLVDVLFALSVIVLAGWLLVIVWALVKFGSSGPGIFAQTRLGRNAVPFTCYKFRTMKVGTKQAGTHEMTADAITGIGAVLRKTKVDELPQVVNILRGELSLVGPRPGLPTQHELRQARQEQGVFAVLPGITGLAQINGVDMSDPQRLARLDASYIAQRGLMLDFKIIVATFLGRGQGDKIKA